VQPATDGRPGPNAIGLADESEEGGLEGVVGVRPGAEKPAAGGENQGPVPPDEQLERGLVASAGPPGDEVGVRDAGGIAAGGSPADTGDQGRQHGARHPGLLSFPMMSPATG
jgi:hypothetical protein